MITVATLTGWGQVVQHLNVPAVYLDTWALSALTQDESRACRLTEALRRRAGTLALSWATISELGRVDEGLARAVEDFIEEQLPRVFFVKVDPFRVIERERAGHRCPASDDELATTLTKLRPEPPKTMTTRGLLSSQMAERRTRWAASRKRLVSIFIERTMALRRDFQTDESFRDLVVAAPRAASTFSVLQTVVEQLLADPTSDLQESDAFDFHHAIVPSVYCQWLVLDKVWTPLVRRAQRLIHDAGVTHRMATVVMKLSGVDHVIDCLQAGSVISLQ